MKKRIRLKSIYLTGKDKRAEINFSSNLTLIYGASNTGKSTAVAFIDYMLGSSTLPDLSLPELIPYESLFLELILPDGNEMLLQRSLKGGAFSSTINGITQTLAPTNVTGSLSAFLLDALDLQNKKILTNESGATRALSFRDLAHLSIVDEQSIQSKRSPVTTGVTTAVVANKNVFTFFLTGQDNSSVIKMPSSKELKTARKGKLELLSQLITEVDEKLKDYPAFPELEAQSSRANAFVMNSSNDLDKLEALIQADLKTRSVISTRLEIENNRVAEIEINLKRFSQLENVYSSDIERLQAIEEAGFLLLLEPDHDCPLCGATPADQKITHSTEYIKAVKESAIAEISNINLLHEELKNTIDQLNKERLILINSIEGNENKISAINSSLSKNIEIVNEKRNLFSKALPNRDSILKGIELYDRRAKLEESKKYYEKEKSQKPPKINYKPPSIRSHEFALEISNTLKEWEFPGNHHVSFDENKFDIRIDGKDRQSNGKGVRAITHAAFKVSLLIYCQKNNLPHPGFVILDSPLLTYRSPQDFKEEFTPEEMVIRALPIKENFFNHLSRLSEYGQFIIFENIDPPQNIKSIASVEKFSGLVGTGRYGFL